jgi:hypothetical protein
MMKLYFNLFVLSFIVPLLLSKLFEYLAQKRLRESHKEVWDVLGRPSPSNLDLEAINNFIKYFSSRQVIELHDKKLDKLRRIWLYCRWTGATSFLIFALIFGYSFFLGN